jgi:hypothetical protein
MKSPREEIRLEVLKQFEPEKEEELNKVYEMLTKEKKNSVKKEALTILIRTKNREIIDKVFACATKNLLGHDTLVKLVELCGQLKIKESVPYLKKIFLTKPLFQSKKSDELRVASAVSLRQLETEDAIEVVKSGLKDRRKKVRDMCRLIMELKEHGR